MSAATHSLSVYVARPVAVVHAYLTNPRNLPVWAPGFARAVRRDGDAWTVETADGPVGFAFLAADREGCCDHRVTLADQTALDVPLRVEAEGDGARVTLTVSRGPAMSDADFARDVALVEADLARLRATLQVPRPAPDRIILRGELYWMATAHPGPDAPGYAHPHVVVQDDVFNRSRVETVVVCALTSNLHRAHEPGNVLLDPGEGDLPRQSVVVVSQISAVPKSQLGERLGVLSSERVEQILAGLRFQQASYFQR